MKVNKINMKILFIGDPHIKTDNNEEVSILLLELQKNCELYHFDRIIIGGDLMHYHERIFTQALNKTLEFVVALSKYAPVDIIVGNHDMINNQQFLSSHHWMHVLSHLENVFVIDKPVSRKIEDFSFLICPYVFPGRFIEALETECKEWKTMNVIFAHQEFKGCKMGAIISKDGDEWKDDNPFVISGHIHDNQRIGKNIYYPGTPLQHAFGDTDKRIVCYIDENGSCTDIPLDVPIKKIINSDIKDIKDIKEFKLKSNESIKLKLKGTAEECKLFKQTTVYNDYINKGVKIQFEVGDSLKVKEVDVNEVESKKKTTFRSILENSVQMDGDALLLKIYKDL
jgi:DNA repair exonuclease SbcCD nuclease subunit